MRILLAILFALSLNKASASEISNIRYDSLGMPVIDAKIDGRYHSLTIDTGSSEGFHLYNYDINNIINKKQSISIENKKIIKIDGMGKKRELTRNVFDALSVNDHEFKRISVVNLKPWGVSMGSENPKGEVIGLGAFKNSISELDFHKNKYRIINDLPHDINDYDAFGFTLTDSGILLSATINKKNVKMILDTASSVSMIFKSAIPAQYEILGCDIIFSQASPGECQVYKVQLNDSSNKIHSDYAMYAENVGADLGFDGLLGMPFLKNKTVIFDMIVHKIYIKKHK